MSPEVQTFSRSTKSSSRTRRPNYLAPNLESRRHKLTNFIKNIEILVPGFSTAKNGITQITDENPLVWRNPRVWSYSPNIPKFSSANIHFPKLLFLCLFLLRSELTFTKSHKNPKNHKVSIFSTLKVTELGGATFAAPTRAGPRPSAGAPLLWQIW